MKEIKFRAFYKTAGEILKVDEISWGFERVRVCITRNERDYYPILKFKDIELMQFTGLKDRNEVEIYEGDILENSIGDLGEVAYIDGAFCFVNCYEWSSLDEAYKQAKIVGDVFKNTNQTFFDVYKCEILKNYTNEKHKKLKELCEPKAILCRLEKEICELDERIYHLNIFLQSEKSSALVDDEARLLKEQLKAMTDYQQILIKRHDLIQTHINKSQKGIKND